MSAARLTGPTGCSQEDTRNFHKAFTSQQPVDSLVSASHLNAAQQANFEGFTYVPSTSDANAIAEEAAKLQLGGRDLVAPPG